MKFTMWFPPHVSPVRSGVYEIADVNGRIWWSWFTKGRGWNGQWRDATRAHQFKRWPKEPLLNTDKWRGVLKAVDSQAKPK